MHESSDLKVETRNTSDKHRLQVCERIGSMAYCLEVTVYITH